MVRNVFIKRFALSAKNAFRKILGIFVAGTALSACVNDSVAILEQTTIITPKAPASVILCRSQQCAPARTNMTREFLYNSLLNLLDNNLNSTVLLCDADPNSRMCVENYIQFPIKAGATPATVVVDSAKLFDVKLNKREQTISAALEYSMLYNGLRPTCQPSKNVLFVKSPDTVFMEDTGFKCKFTTVGSSMLSTVFAIDYVDLDYGIIGANYSVGVAGPAFGGGTGYVLLRFQKNAFPSDPKKFVLPKTYEENPPTEPKKASQSLGQKTNAERIAPGRYKVSPLPLK